MAIRQRSPRTEILSAVEAVRILNEKGLASEWARFLDNYTSSGVPDARALATIGQALGVDTILQGEMVNVVQQDGAYGRNRGQTRVTVRFTMLGVSNGKLLWQASSDGLRETTTTVESAPPIVEAIDLAISRVLESLPL